jgi:phospholipase C
MAFLADCSAPAGSLSTIPRADWFVRRLSGSSPITHVVIIVQENRTVDNLFNGFPGANTVTSGENSLGQMVPLRSVALKAPYDVYHGHNAFDVEYAGGNLNGFDRVQSSCRAKTPPKQCPPANVRAYAYVPKTNVQPYWDMASQYTLADDTFQSNQGPSFPAHQYLVSGTSTLWDGSPLRAAENPILPGGKAQTGGCDAPKGSIVIAIDQNGGEGHKHFPCFVRSSLMGEADAASVSWRYYQAFSGPGLWNAPDAISAIRYGNSFANVIVPSSQILTDISNGDLASIVWVIPTTAASDHPEINDGTGPSWVASVVNAIGESQFWDSTAIFVTWDDWGGWYDHVVPPVYNSFELGFRVPLLVISPYAKQGYVSHAQHEFGSILKFTEETFGLPSMDTTDERADDLSDCFTFGSKLHPFKRIRAQYPAAYFLRQAALRRGNPGVEE